MINWGFAGCVVLIFSTMVFGGAVNPQPPVGASVDPDTLSLMWTAGTGAIRSEVYIGTNAAAVGNAQKPIGDVNGDGLVDILDLAETAAQWLAAPADPCADLNYSGRVDLADVAELSRSWGQSADVLYLGAASGNSIDPPDPISVNKTYYWRVDTVRCDGIEKGAVWNFKTLRPAFPGAEGFGKWASGGRGGSVYHVTNLNDSGPGSFRDAVSATNRTVVFDVGGVIHIGARIVVSKDITIAGQTAPGEGVAIYGNGLSFTNANRTIARYMRFRMGKIGASGKDGIAIANGTNMIFDHCSVSWGRDENFSISGGSGEDPGLVTIQNCLIAQGLVPHSCGGLIQDFNGVSILRTLYIDNDTRNPKVKGINEYINNVIYNWNSAAYILGDSAADSYANVIGNYFISGPNTGAAPFTRGNLNFHIYALNNYHDSNKNGLLDGSLLSQGAYGTVDWQTVAYDYPGVKTLHPVQTAYKIVSSRAGACLPIRDRHDTRLIKELNSLGTSGQLISDENNSPMYGIGILDSGINPTDTDQDGMPDYWEQSIAGLNVLVADHNGDADGNGYTNLEDYLNFLGSLHAHMQKNTPRDINLRRFTSGFGSGATYTVFDAVGGTVALLADGFTARFTPEANYIGQARFRFTVQDAESFTDTVQLLVSEYGGHPLPPLYPSNLRSGLSYKYYTGAWNYLPDFALLNAAGQGNIANFDISGAAAEDNFGYIFEGYIDVPADGLYAFYLKSDDGSKLYIDEGIVVSNDGVHGTQETEGWVALLAGKHKIRVAYFEREGSQRLEVRWAGPGFEKQLIGDNVLFRGDLDQGAPAAPTGLWAQGSNGQVFLDWDENSEPDLGGYNIYRTTASGGSYVRQNSSLITAANYIDYTVENGTMYHYVLSAVDNSFNESSWTPEVSALPTDSNDVSLIIQEYTPGFCRVEGTVDNNHAGFTGSGFCNADNNTSSGINWSVSIGAAGTYTLTFRYAHGKTDDRTARLLIDGQTVFSTVEFPITGAWTTWAEVSKTLPLSVGTYPVRLEPTRSDGLANIDYLMLTGLDVEPAACP